MIRLVPLILTPGDDPQVWVNPDHVVYVQDATEEGQEDPKDLTTIVRVTGGERFVIDGDPRVVVDLLLGLKDPPIWP